MFRLIFFLTNTSLTSSTKVAVENTLLFKEYTPKKLSILFLRWNLDGPPMPRLSVILTHLAFGIHISPKQLTSFLLSRSQSKTFYLFWNFPFKMINCISCSGILMDQKCEKMLFLTCLNVQTQISSLPYLLRFTIKESIEFFFSFEADYLFLNILKIILYIGIKMLIDHKWQKCY